jgi:hypothetical protein
MRREANSALSDRASCSARYHHADPGPLGSLTSKVADCREASDASTRRMRDRTVQF